MKMKAQAAMEYLMTYGWAILIVIIVAVALYMLGVFSPMAGTHTASAFPNLGMPQDWYYSESTDGLTVIIPNYFGRSVTVLGNDTVVTQLPSGTLCNSYATGYSIDPGSSYTATIDCSNLGTAAPNQGDAFSFRVDVEFKPAGSTYTLTDSATVSGTASA